MIFFHEDREKWFERELSGPVGLRLEKWLFGGEGFFFLLENENGGGVY